MHRGARLRSIHSMSFISSSLLGKLHYSNVDDFYVEKEMIVN